VAGKRFLGKLQIALLIAGTLALGYSGAVTLRGFLYQRHAIEQLEKKDVTQSSRSAGVQPGLTENASPPYGRALQRVVAGSSFARLSIDRLHIDVAVIEGDSDADLRLGAGHVPYTALPGNSGNVGIAAHRDTFFRPLRNIQKGDIIALSTPEDTYEYRVDSTQIVTPDHSEVLGPTPEPSLTLVTCFPFYYVGSAPKRFIVRAHQLKATETNADLHTGS
jgi:sortase A